MRVVGILAFALAALVNSTVGLGYEPMILGSGLIIRKINVHAEEKMFYRKTFGPLSSLRLLTGTHLFFERDGYILGWGFSGKPIRAMYDESGKPYIMGPYSYTRQYREEWQMEGYCIGMIMPPYYPSNSREL